MSDNLNAARGSITIDTSQLDAARASVQAFATGVNTTLTGISTSTTQAAAGISQVASSAGKAQQGLSQLTGVARQVAGAFGISFGIAGVVQLGKLALAADATATAYNRQSIAAVNLAGSQGKLNELLATYDKATGGAIGKAQALADVTKLQAIGFAHSAAELDQFARAARGISIAMGVQQDYVVSQLTLAISNKSFMRLDQLGLDAEEARRRIDELKAANASMTDDMAYRQAILEQAKEKFGSLADTAATGAERAATSWDNLGLAIGQAIGPGISVEMDVLTAKINEQTTQLNIFVALLQKAGQLAKNLNSGGGMSGEARPGSPIPSTPADVTRIRQDIADDQSQVDALKQSLVELNAVHDVDVSQEVLRTSNMIADLTHNIENLQGQLHNYVQPTLLDSAANRSGNTPPKAITDSPEVKAVKLDFAQGIQRLNNDTNEQLLQQNSDYQRQRSDSERSYQESTLRAAEDFGLQRQREEQDLADSISRIHRDSANREARQAADLARSIGQATADSAERVAKDKKDANERLAELDTNYEKEKVKRAKDLSDKLLDAAGNLDAKQVYELQRDAAKQEEEAKTAHDDQRDKLQKQLAERLDDESKSLSKSITQQQDAYQRQLQDSRDADSQRITDMQADFAKRTAQEDIDYGIRMDRMAQDHTEQMAEMERAQGLRIQQIQDHATKERAQLDDEHQRALIKLGVHNQEWLDAETKADDAALKELDRTIRAGRSLLFFPNAGSNQIPTPSMIGGNAVAPYSGASSYSNSSRSVTVGNVTVSLGDVGGRSDEQIKRIVRDGIIEALEEAAQ